MFALATAGKFSRIASDTSRRSSTLIKPPEELLSRKTAYRRNDEL
jgi:hypothetical protein